MNGESQKQRESRNRRIRDGFTGGTIDAYADHLDAIGLFNAEDRERQRVRGRNAEVGAALAYILPGVRYAGPVPGSSNGRFDWMRVKLWPALAFDINTSRRNLQRGALATMIRKLDAECYQLHKRHARSNLNRDQIKALLAKNKKK